MSRFIKRGNLDLVSKDDEDFQVAQVKYMGKPADVELVFPYGLCANPPKDSLVLMWSILGAEENRAGMANYPQRRFKDLKEGEVVLYNYLTGSYIKFDKDGNIVINSTKEHNSNTEEDQNVTIKKDLNVDIYGDVNIHVRGDVNIQVDGDTEGNLSINGGGLNIDIINAIVRLGGEDGERIARLGDAVLVGGVYGEIVEAGEHYAT